MGKMRYYSFLDYLYFRDHTRVFSGLLASTYDELMIARDSASEEPQVIQGEFVTDNFFSVLGAKTVLGRTFAPEENRAPGQHPVVVIGHQFWQRHFGGDPKIVGQTVRINAKPFVVIGVTAPDFVGLGEWIPEVWLPMVMSFRFQEHVNSRNGWLNSMPFSFFPGGVARDMNDSSETWAYGLQFL
jgi:MacB-like periplasmic core domain